MKFLPGRVFSWIISLLLSHWKWVLKFVLHFNFSPIDIYICFVFNFVRMMKFWLKSYRYIHIFGSVRFFSCKVWSTFPQYQCYAGQAIKQSKKPKLKFKLWIVVCVTIPFSFRFFQPWHCLEFSASFSTFRSPFATQTVNRFGLWASLLT